MKKTFLVICILLSVSTLFGQKKLKLQPLIIKGQLINCPEKYLIIFLDHDLTDTLHVDKNGNFYLKTFKIKYPQCVNIGYNKTIIHNVFIAPGYNLTITGDIKNPNSLLESLKIKGIGSESNAYSIKALAAEVAESRLESWYELNDVKLLAYIKRDYKLKDSLAHVIFDKRPVHDPYFNFFKKMAHLDNEFMRLYYLVALIDINKYDYQKSVTLLRNNFDHHILDNISKDEYLVSNIYKASVIGKYLQYSINLDYSKDSTLRSDKYYALQRASKIYTGKVKEYALYYLMTSSSAIPSIKYARSFNDLNKCKKQFKSYISVLSNPFYKKSIDEKFSEKQVELARTAVGQPAPVFTLQSNLGRMYNLSDFKGKVVYLDLWASWCEPCRAETPYLKVLYDKYKNDSRVAFISVSVSDVINDWKKALEQDKPGWIQLMDKDGLVSKAYVANLIPQFVIIDKQGNIANLDAPTPSSGKVEALLLAEMAK